MNKPKVRKVYLKLLALLPIPFLLSGCAEKMDCDIKEDHVHKFINKKTKVVTYIMSEMNPSYGYEWQKENFKITEDDYNFYTTKGPLFDGVENWRYLYAVMASKSDYLEFYYEYETDDYVSQTDEDGNECGYWTTTTHTGWTRDPYYMHNTGRVNLCHHRFFGYDIVYNTQKKKYERVESRLVDDIRDIINDYPYFPDDCSRVVNHEFNVNKRELPHLKPSDFNYFHGPDLSNRELSNSK